jgi:protein-tyrosine phosphatase
MLVSRSEVLMLCTANVCRSPMAQALLARRLATLGRPATVRSGGMLSEGEPPRPEVVAAMAARGLDVSAHRSHRVSPADLDRADLTLAMTRGNLRHAVVLAPAAWPRAFTLRELVRRGAAIGPRRPGEALADWLARAHDGRRRATLLGDCANDDVADPIGRPRSCYTETAAILSGLIDELADLCWTAAGSEPGPGAVSRPLAREGQADRVR